ncbi:MAG: TetR/AcrR family transcriptional regulator [Methylovirgula sp.]
MPLKIKPQKTPPKAVPQRAAAYHHGDLRIALVKAARDILEKEGLEALSLRAVARNAGVSQAAPYHHFADKQALLDAVAAEGFQSLRSAMEVRIAKETEPLARLYASGLGYIAFATENPALFRLMFSELSGDAQLRTARDSAYQVFQDAVAAVAPAGAPLAIICLGLWARVHGLAKLILEAGVDPADYGAANAEALAAQLLYNSSPL